MSLSPPTTVHVDRVVKRFGPVTAVNQLDLQIRKGEFFSMLGPSGCGKTTTLRIIAGFEQPDEGDVYLEGRPVASVPPYRRNVNTVFQSYALFEHLTAWENVAFGLRRRRVPEPEIRKRVADMLELVRLKGKAMARPRQLSGGQQQRVALARALVNLPAVLLLDEPLGALDLQLRKQMQIELKQIQRTVGITFVYVTHDQEEALTMSDRIAVMNDGVLQQCGTPEEIYERPLNAFVAGFIGISNLLPGVVEDHAVRLQSTGQLVPADVAAYRPGDPVLLCVRPEKLRLEPAPESGVSVEGTVVETVYLGTSTQYLVELAPGVRLTAIENNVLTARPEDRVQRGSRLRVSWLPEHGRVLQS
ncbi:MAG TPA: ABC transporter ATP-binding protein [Candidatus Limnocylindrales bacterium]|nr:ABC transporter ATP-binding protein [Candidatus Limnocylindrales bacterium]